MISPDEYALMAPPTPPNLSMQEAYLIPYGAIGFASDILTLYMVTCLLFGRAPLCPVTRIRKTDLAKFLIGLWIFFIFVLNEYNVEKCWQHWELVLINVSNGLMGLFVALIGFFTVSSWHTLVKGEAQQDDPESQPALGEISLSTAEQETAVSDERICDSTREYGAMADMPSSGLSRVGSSSMQGQSNRTSNVSPHMSEVARELNSMANGPAQSGDQKVKVVFLAVLGVHIGAVLIGSIFLARLAVLEGRESSKEICLIFGILGGLTIVGTLFTFACCVLDSLSGVPIADIGMEELSRYWVYLAVTKLPMFAF